MRKPKGWRIANTNNLLLVPEIDILQGITGLTLKYPRTAWLHRNQKVRIRSALSPAAVTLARMGHVQSPRCSKALGIETKDGPHCAWCRSSNLPDLRLRKGNNRTSGKAANLIETGWNMKKRSCRKCTSKYNEIYQMLYDSSNWNKFTEICGSEDPVYPYVTICFHYNSATQSRFISRSGEFLSGEFLSEPWRPAVNISHRKSCHLTHCTLPNFNQMKSPVKPPFPALLQLRHPTNRLSPEAHPCGSSLRILRAPLCTPWCPRKYGQQNQKQNFLSANMGILNFFELQNCCHWSGINAMCSPKRVLHESVQYWVAQR